MATIAQLETAYTAITRLTPSAAQSLILQDLATRSQNGVITDAQAYQYIIGQASGTTTVAALSYQFFTGKTPTSAGFDYLVNSTTNTSDLNDPAYQAFNLENRYINFAVNLGVIGEGRTNFVATFGGLSFADTVAVAYNRIIGNAQATAAGIDVNAAIANIAGRKAYFDAVAKAGAPAADADLAAKAAVVGYIMAEAVKAQVGVYSNGVNNFYLDLAPDGKANYNVDLNTYVNNDDGQGGPGTPGNTITLAADTSVALGAAGSTTASTDNNDTATGTISAATADKSYAFGNGADTIGVSATPVGVTAAATKTVTVDLGGGNDVAFLATTEVATGVIVLDGGVGTDTLNLTVTATGVTDGITSITGFENINLISTASKTVDMDAVTGATSLTLSNSAGTLTLDNVGSQAVNLAGAGNAVINYDDVSSATITLKGPTAGTIGTITTGGDLDDTLTLAVTKALTLGGVTTGADTLITTGNFSVVMGTVVLGGDDATINLSAATSRNVSLTYVGDGDTTSLTTGGGNDTVTFTAGSADANTVVLGAGNDTLNLTLASKGAGSIALGDGSDTVNVTVGAGNIGSFTSAGALKFATVISDFDLGDDTVNITGGTYVAAASNAFDGAAGATDQARFTTAQGIVGGANEFTAFDAADGSGVWIYSDGATTGTGDDVAIKLVGVTLADLDITGVAITGA